MKQSCIVTSSNIKELQLTIDNDFIVLSVDYYEYPLLDFELSSIDLFQAFNDFSDSTEAINYLKTNPEELDEFLLNEDIKPIFVVLDTETNKYIYSLKEVANGVCVGLVDTSNDEYKRELSDFVAYLNNELYYIDTVSITLNDEVIFESQDYGELLVQDYFRKDMSELLIFYLQGVQGYLEDEESIWVIDELINGIDSNIDLFVI